MKKAVSILCIAVLLAGLTACDKTCKHDYRGWIVVKDPSCTEVGTEQRRCRECNEKETRDIPAIGHNYTESITKEPSCMGVGIKTFTCSNCDDAYEEEIPYSTYDANQVFEMSKDGVGEIVTYDKSGKGLALGTGFVYAADGKIITNYHVIEGAYSAVININGSSYNVLRVLAYDKDIDLAVLKISAGGLHTLPLCENHHAVGKTVYAFGSSKGLTATFSRGIITYADRESDGVHYVQHDAAISSGNSGGPLINEHGEVIGINTLTIRDSQNLNFAISVRELDNLDFSKSMTMAELYDKESNVQEILKNYALSNGIYSDESYTVPLSADSNPSSSYVFALSHHTTQKANALLLIYQDSSNNQHVFSFVFVQDTVVWVYIQGSNQMAGQITPSAFHSGTKLQYLETNFSSSSRATAQGIASGLATILCTYMDELLHDTGVTAAELGFVNF